MKTVPLVYFSSRQRGVRNIEGIAGCLGDALVRAGYHVPHLCWGAPEFDRGLASAMGAREIEFVFVLGQYPINLPVQGFRIWEHPRFRNVPFFAYLIDSVIYELQPIVIEILKTASDRFTFGLYDTSGQLLFHRFARSFESRARILSIPFGAPTVFRRSMPWRDRPLDIAFSGNIGLELQGLREGQTVEEMFADYKDSSIPYRRVVEAVKELHSNPNGALIDQLMAMLSIEPHSLADRKLLMLVWAIDSYIKRQRRIEIVQRLAKSRRKLHIFGSGWEKVAATRPNVELHGVKDWSAQDEIFDQAKILLNIEPNTFGGANDRVFGATANGAVLLSQRNPVIDTTLVDGNGYIGYDPTGVDIVDVLDRSDDELEAIAAAGAAKSRAFHTWDHRIRDVINYLQALSAKDETAAIVYQQGGEVTEEILRLDGKDDHVGVFSYISNAQYADADALFVLFKLLAAGRFQSAFLVAKVMAGRGVNNPTIDLARSLGGAIFGNAADEADGTDRLRRWMERLSAGQLDQFRASVAAPTFAQAMDAKVIGNDRTLAAKVQAIRGLVLPEPPPRPSAETAHEAPSRPPSKRPHKARTPAR